MIDVTDKPEIHYLSEMTGLSRRAVYEALGDSYQGKIFFSRKRDRDGFEREEKQARRILKECENLREAVNEFQRDDRFRPRRIDMPDLDELERKAQSVIRVAHARNVWVHVPKGAKSWASVVIAAGVARVFTAASLPLTVGDKEGPHGREASTDYCRAVAHLLQLFKVIADVRRAAERGKELRDEA